MRLDAVSARAEPQYGLIARRQLLELGATADDVWTLLRSGRLTGELPGVYAFPGHRPSWRRTLWAAHLHAGPASVIGFESAAQLQGFPQARRGAVAVIVPSTAKAAPPAVRWHRLGDLVGREIGAVDGLPVTLPARTLMDLGARLGVTTLRAAVEHAAVERLCTLGEVGAVLARVRRRGKPGVAKLERVLDDLGSGATVPRSELERLLDLAIRDAGLPRPHHEYPLPGATRPEFVDRAWPAARLIVEADGRRWHSRRAQQARDADRDLLAATHGWLTVRLMWERLRHDRPAVAAALRRIHDGRLPPP
jgi:hypothetical protein